METYYQDVQKTLQAPHRFLGAAFAPSTALNYALTAAARIPAVRQDPKTKEAILFLKKRAATATLKKAVPILPDQLSQAIDTASPRTANTILLMWLGAARHADLRAARLEKSFGKGKSKVACLRFGPWKSDPTGNRQATKALPTNSALLKMMRSQDFASFNAVKNALRKVDHSLTVHSIRRGAIQFLADRYSPLQIAALTQHAAGQETSAVHKYTPPTMTGPLPTLQLQLASELWNALSSTSSQEQKETGHISHGKSDTTTGM